MLQGVTALLFTPFTGEGHLIDAVSMGRQVDRVLAAGVDNVVACGKAGEFEGLQPAEIEQVLSIVVDQVGGRMPVGMGIISVEEEEALQAAAIGLGCGVVEVVERAVNVADRPVGPRRRGVQRHQVLHQPAVIEARRRGPLIRELLQRDVDLLLGQ